MTKQLEELIRLGWKKQAEIKVSEYHIQIYAMAYNKLWYCPEKDKVIMKYSMLDKVFKNSN